MAMFMHRKDNKIKVEFSITIHTLKNLPNTVTGHDLFVECKRGSKAKNHYNTKKITASGITNVSWEEKFKINSTFYEDPKTKKIDQKKKELTFTVKEESSKSKDKKVETVTLGKGAINLTIFAEPNTVRHEAVTLKTEKKTAIAPTLMIKVESNWVKIGDKNLVKKPATTGSTEISKTPRGSNDSTRKEEIKIGNEEYVLQTADEVTDTQASDDEDDLEEDKLEEDDNRSLSSNSNDKKDTTSSEADVKYLKERYETEIQDLIKDRERLEKKVTRLTSEKDKAVENLKAAEAKAAATPATTTSTSSNNNDELEAEIEDLKTDKSRLESKVERLNKDLESKKKEIEESKTTSQSFAEEKTKLNSKIKELEKIIEEEKKSKASIQDSLDKSMSKKRSSLDDKEIDNLKKQLEESKKNIEDLKKQVEEYKAKAALVPSSPVVSTKELDASKKQVDDLKKQVEDFKKQVEDLKKQVKELNETVDDQKDDIASLKKDKEKLEKEKDKLTSQMTATAAASTSKSNEQSKKLEDKITLLEQQIQEQEESISDLKSTNEKLEEKVDSKSEKLLEYKRKVKEYEDTKKSNEQSITEKDNKIISLESKITSLQIELESKSSSKSESKESPAASRLKELQAQVESLSKNLADQKKESSDKLSNYETKVSDLQTKLQNSQSSSSTKEKESSRQLDDMKKDYDSLKKKLREEEKSKTAIEEDLNSARKKISELEASLSSASSNVSSANSTPSQSTKKEDEEEQLKKKIQAMRQEKEVETLKKKVTALQRENEERKLIESAIYAAEPEYDEETHVPTHVATIIESLINWNSFDPANEELLSNIVSSIKKSFTRSAYDSEILAYWLSLTSSLYVQLKKEISESIDLNEEFLTQQLLISDENQIDSMDPSVKFFYDLILLAFDIYSVLLINIYSQIDHILLPPLLEKSNAIIDSKGSDKAKKTTNDFAIILADILKLLKKNFISETLQTHFMRQIFYFMDAQVFNTLLRKPELFTASNGFQIKMAISQVESQLGKVDKQLLSIAHNGLHHTREAANLLVMDKSIVSDEQTVSQIFSNLNIVQIKHILDKFKPDDLSPETIPPSVKQSLESAARRHADLALQLDPMSIKKVNLFTK